MFSERLKRLRAYKTETTPARVKLSSNELPYDLPDSLKNLIAKDLSKAELNRYPDPSSGELREALGKFMNVPPQNIAVGNGSDELIYYLSMSVGELDQGILIPTPTFPMYEISAEVLGRPKVCVPLDKDFDIDLQKAVASSEEAVMAYYAYPNNPTGNLFSRSKITTLREKGVFSVIDEAYYHYSGETFLQDALSREDTVVLRTLSKIGLAGLRVGMLIAKEEVVEEINKVRLPFNVTLPSQIAARVVLKEGREFIEWAVGEVIKERDRLIKEMANIKGVEVFPSKANFILFRTPHEAGTIHRELVERGVLIRNMSYLPSLDRCLRVSVGKPEENDAFLEALYNVLSCLE